MKYFNDFMNIEELRKLFRQYCLELHPDKGGKHEDFIEMREEYEKILKFACDNEKGKAESEDRATAFDFENEKELYEMIIELMKIPQIIIEVCGCWLWISGNTFPVHEQIKDLGAKYSKNKKRWYYSPYMGGGKRRGRYTMEKIRNKFGSVVIESEAETQKVIAA